MMDNLSMKSILKNGMTWIILIDIVFVVCYVTTVNSRFIERPLVSEVIKSPIYPKDFNSVLNITWINILWLSFITILSKKRLFYSIGKLNIVYVSFVSSLFIVFAIYIGSCDCSYLKYLENDSSGVAYNAFSMFVPNSIREHNWYPIALLIISWLIIEIMGFKIIVMKIGDNL